MIMKNPTNLKLAICICFLFPLCSWIPLTLAQNKTYISVNVGIVLDDLEYSLTRKIWLSYMKMSLSDFYGSHPYYKTMLILNTRHSRKSVVGAAAAALDLIKNNQVHAIMGPVTSAQTSFVISLGGQAHVPIISFSATNPSLSLLRSPYFFQFAETDSSQVKAISAIVETIGWKQVVLIYVDTEYGEGLIPYLTDALQKVNAHVMYRSAISTSATYGEIAEELKKLMMLETRVFIVHMTTDLSCRLFSIAKEMGMMSEGYAWLTTSKVTNSLTSQNSSILTSMQGVLGVQTYIPKTVKLDEFNLRWRRHFEKNNPTIISAGLDVVGLWAYDAVFALAMAIEQEFGTKSNFLFQNSNASKELSYLDSIPVNLFGSDLRKALSTTRFEGIAGNFSLVNNQRQSSTFRIINVNGGGVKEIGFWTGQNGLVKTLDTSVSSSKWNVGPIMWPGGTGSVPKGWEIPLKGKRLRIGVPVKIEFTEFVNITKDPDTNNTLITGFSIEVFKAVVDSLPYDLPYDFIPYANPDGTTAGTYNDLCEQVVLGNFDAAVGDITIRAGRSLSVDFTMPYEQSGIVMVVPFIHHRSKYTFTFLKPWRWDLWLTTCVFFIYVGFVVWVLEHRINKDFRGPPSHQVGTSVWFSCSSMVFAHRERVVSNLARFVMIIWVFVLLILTINYTASLSSLYTAEQLHPTVTDLMDLLTKGDNIGFIKCSFVYDLLKQVGFDDSKIKPLVTMEEIDKALTKGSANGGISAIVHETPKMKIFLAKYGSKYTMLPPIFKSEGFAFVLPKRSPLRQDISQAILNKTGDGVIMKLESQWLSKEIKSQVPSNGLRLDSFWVLFLVVGFASILALVIFVASFIQKHWHSLMQSDDSKPSKWSKIKAMFEIFNERDLSCHTFRDHSQSGNDSNRTDNTDYVLNGVETTNMVDQALPNMHTVMPATLERITIQEMHRNT